MVDQLDLENLNLKTETLINVYKTKNISTKEMSFVVKQVEIGGKLFVPIIRRLYELLTKN